MSQDGDFSKSAIVDFVSDNKLPLIINFTMESASFVFEGPIQKQVCPLYDFFFIFLYSHDLNVIFHCPFEIVIDDNNSLYRILLLAAISEEHIV